LNVKHVIAIRNYENLNTGTVDLLVKCNMHIYSDGQRSQWSLQLLQVTPDVCANASCKPASCTLHGTASIITYRLTFFIVVGTGFRNGAHVDIVFNL